MYGNDNDLARKAGARLAGAVVLGLVCLAVSLLCRCCRRALTRGGPVAPPPAAVNPSATSFGEAIPLPAPTPRLYPQRAPAPADALPPAYSQVVLGAKQPPYNMNAPH